MWQRISHFAQTVAGGAAIIAVASLVSRMVGLVRDNLFAQTFGASATLDMYNAAFKVPDFIFNIIVLGALSASFVPIYIEHRTKAGEDDANRLAGTVFMLLAITLCVLAVIGWFLAKPLASWLMAERSLAEQLGTAELMQVMLLSVICLGLSNVFSGILQAKQKFLAFALAPIVYNLGIIIGILWLYPIFDIIGLAYGVVLGAVLHLIIQGTAAVMQGYRFYPSLNFRLPGVQQLLRLMPPRAFSLGVAQINTLILVAFALRLPSGSLVIWTWADNLQHVPINMVGVSLAISAFPVFSQAFADQDLNKFKQVFSSNFRRMLFLIVPISVAILLLRAQFVRIILGSFGSGAFDWADTYATAQVLGIFAVALFAQSAIPMLARSFFAHHDTKSTVWVSVLTVLLNVGLAYGLSSYLGLYGLALAYSIASLFNMLVLLIVLRIKFGDLDDVVMIQSIWRIVLGSVAAGLVIHGLKYVIAPLVDMHTFLGVFVQTVGSLSGGVIIYLGIAYYFNYPELGIVKQHLKKLRQLLA